MIRPLALSRCPRSPPDVQVRLPVRKGCLHTQCNLHENIASHQANNDGPHGGCTSPIYFTIIQCASYSRSRLCDLHVFDVLLYVRKSASYCMYQKMNTGTHECEPNAVFIYAHSNFAVEYYTACPPGGPVPQIVGSLPWAARATVAPCHGILFMSPLFNPYQIKSHHAACGGTHYYFVNPVCGLARPLGCALPGSSVTCICTFYVSQYINPPPGEHIWSNGGIGRWTFQCCFYNLFPRTSPTRGADLSLCVFYQNIENKSRHAPFTVLCSVITVNVGNCRKIDTNIASLSCPNTKTCTSRDLQYDGITPCSAPSKYKQTIHTPMICTDPDIDSHLPGEQHPESLDRTEMPNPGRPASTHRHDILYSNKPP